jgi:hypothetical protein
MTTKTTAPATAYTMDVVTIGRCAACKRGSRHTFSVDGWGDVFATTVAGPFSYDANGRSAVVRCECGKAVRLRPLVGSLNTAKACTARCMGATGPACECECGGENHGGKWVA